MSVGGDTPMNKRDIKRLRTMRYFIDAAQGILEEEGLDGLTIRRVADRAGYNSATIYSYFENLEHLAFYASLKYLKSYLVRLSAMTLPHNGLERFTAIWRCFAAEAFQYPDYYYNIFYAPHRFQFNDSIRLYYQIYPEQLENISEDLLPMLMGSNIYERDFESLKRCVDQGYFSADRIPEINDIVVLLFQSYLLRVRSGESDLPLEEHVDRIIRYFTAIIKGYICKARNPNPAQ